MGRVRQRHKDESAYRRLFTDHFDAVTGYAMRRAAPADAADVVAETMLVAWRRLAEVPAEPATRPWLLGVARRVLANQRRGELRKAGLSDRLAADLGLLHTTLAPDPADTAIERRRLQAALDALSPDDREVILMSVWEGLSPAQLAVVFDIPPVTARTRLHRARSRFRSAVESFDGVERSNDIGHFLCDGDHPVPLASKGDA